EESGDQPWRWMGAKSVATLPPLRGKGVLHLSLYVPLDALPSPPSVTVRMNGVVVDTFRGVRSFMERDVTVDGRADAPNELMIETDRVVAPAARGLNADTRTLGLRLNELTWMAR